MNADAIFDFRGLRCPLPVLKTDRRLAAMEAGARVEIISDDPLAAVDIPHYCREKGHHMVGHKAEGDVLTFLVEKG